MMERPNPILHMAGYGLIYGWLLAMLYIWSFIIFEGTVEPSMDLQGIAIAGVSGAYSFIFGAFPGVLMGYFGGRILRFLTRHIVPPLHHDIYIETRNLSLAIISGLTFLGMTCLLSSLFGLPTLHNIFGWMMLTMFPGLVAGGAAAYAVHRYMLKLRTWANVGKTKNDYKPKNQLAYNDAAQDVMTTETESQQDSLTS